MIRSQSFKTEFERYQRSVADEIERAKQDAYLIALADVMPTITTAFISERFQERFGQYIAPRQIHQRIKDAAGRIG